MWFTLCYHVPLFAQGIVETTYFLENPELGGEGTIKKSVQSCENNFAIVTFYVNVDSSGNYFANFWMCPAETKTGEFHQYLIRVNNHNVGTLNPQTFGWQSVGLADNMQIPLIKGENTISVIGLAPAFPNVEHVRVASSLKEAQISSAMYDEYIKQMETNKLNNDDDTESSTLGKSSNRKSIANSTTEEDPLYEYEYQTNITANYTFYQTFSFTAGQTVSIKTNGLNNFRHILYLFSASEPENYSWANRQGCSDSINVTIPQSGVYYVMVRSNNNNIFGYCNLIINNEYRFTGIPVNCNRVVCAMDTTTTYNTFTVKTQGNPILWIEEENGLLSYGKICSYNDNYQGDGNFNWGTNARIKRKFDRPTKAVLVSHNGAYSPVSTLDLYMKCKECHSHVIGNHSNLKDDDVIQSSSIPGYNCISWSGGITSYWEWPLNSSSSYRDTITYDDLTSFDNFYRSRGLTRVGADSTNAIVALWGNDIGNGVIDYTHASVRNGDGNLHGYDWESKLGAYERIFHPENALNGYGHIVEYYTHDPNSSFDSSMSLENEIAEGLSRIEYINFDEYEKNIISNAINDIQDSVMNQFLSLYVKWKYVTDHTMHSSFDLIANCNEFRIALNYCKENCELRYVLFDFLNKGDLASLLLVDALISYDNSEDIKLTHARSKERDMKSNVNTYRSPISNCIAFIKTLIQKDDATNVAKIQSNTTGITGVSYSNSDVFHVSESRDNIKIAFNLSHESIISLETLDLSGRTTSAPIIEQRFRAGDHSFTINIGHKDIILIKFTVDGRVNIKKYFIR